MWLTIATDIYTGSLHCLPLILASLNLDEENDNIEPNVTKTVCLEEVENESKVVRNSQ